MALSLADCDAMIKAAKEHDRLLSVFHNRRWDGDFLTVRKLVREGALGPVRWIELAYQVVRSSPIHLHSFSAIDTTRHARHTTRHDTHGTLHACA
jgi:predicted dehydrogenase